MPPAAFNTTIDYIGTVRGRIGYAFGTLMPYVTGGFAWGHTHADINDGSGAIIGHYQSGWTAGLGLEFAVSGNWSAKLEYDYVDLSRQRLRSLRLRAADVNVDPRIHLAKIGLNYHFGDTPWNPARRKPLLPESDVWNVHAQTTFLPQGYGPIHSPYVGPYSLPPGGQLQATWTTTAFLGVKLWEGGEFYFNPELAQGFGINGTLGIAGFPNGEAQKAGAPFPKIRAQRYYFKQTFGLGGEQEDVADGAEPACRQARHRSRDRHRRPLCGRRLLRQQFLCARPARRLHELGDVGVRRPTTSRPTCPAIPAAPWSS